jgi:hypothetical protein
MPGSQENPPFRNRTAPVLTVADKRLAWEAKRHVVQFRIGSQFDVDGPGYVGEAGSASHNQYFRFASYAEANKWLREDLPRGPHRNKKLAPETVKNRGALLKAVGIIPSQSPRRTAPHQGLFDFSVRQIEGTAIEPAPPPAPDDPLDGLLDHAAGLLQVVPQIVLQGPPGTGKTYTAKRLAARLLGIGASAVDEEESKTTGEFHDACFSEGRDGGCWELVQFHPA